jgi:hypothetical protein
MIVRILFLVLDLAIQTPTPGTIERLDWGLKEHEEQLRQLLPDSFDFLEKELKEPILTNQQALKLVGPLISYEVGQEIMVNLEELEKEVRGDILEGRKALASGDLRLAAQRAIEATRFSNLILQTQLDLFKLFVADLDGLKEELKKLLEDLKKKKGIPI